MAAYHPWWSAIDSMLLRQWLHDVVTLWVLSVNWYWQYQGVSSLECHTTGSCLPFLPASAKHLTKNQEIQKSFESTNNSEPSHATGGAWTRTLSPERDFKSLVSASLRQSQFLFVSSFDFSLRERFFLREREGFAFFDKIILPPFSLHVNHAKLFHLVVLDLRSVWGPEHRRGRLLCPDALLCCLFCWNFPGHDFGLWCWKSVHFVRYEAIILLENRLDEIL